jgi:hypothetical protein
LEIVIIFDTLSEDYDSITCEITKDPK